VLNLDARDVRAFVPAKDSCSIASRSFVKCANRQTTRRSIWHRLCVMQDLLQYIDLDYYRSAQLLIARAEIAQLQSSASTRAEGRCNMPTGASRPVGDFHQTALATSSPENAIQSLQRS
jgi:hypothetical protein